MISVKKILLIHHSGLIGGAGLSFLHLADSIPKDKFKIEIICPKHPRDMSNLLKAKGFNVTETENSPKIFPHYNGGIKYGLSVRTLKNLIDLNKDKNRINTLIKKINPDIIVVNSMTLFWIGKIAKNLNIKAICFHRESYQKGLLGVRTRIIKYGLSNWFDKIVFISKYDLYETGLTKAVKSVIHDKVDIEQYHNKNIKDLKRKFHLNCNDKYILYLGGISKLKGSHIILSAMQFLKDENVKLIFVSEIESYSSLSPTSLGNIKLILQIKKILSIINKHNIKENIIFLEKTSNPEDYYLVSDLVVFPSTLAHQARPVYEAGIAKKPMIITDFDNTKEFTKGRVLTFENKNSYDLSLKIKSVLNTDISRTLTKNNYNYSFKYHNLNDMKEEIYNLLEEL